MCCNAQRQEVKKHTIYSDKHSYWKKVNSENFLPAEKYDSASCFNCRVNKFCLSKDLSLDELKEFNKSIHQRKKVRKGEKLLSTGTNFSSVHIIRSGSFKTFINTANGLGHLIGFQMSGYCLGLDGFSKEKYESDAVAIEDSVVCSISVQAIEILLQRFPNFQRRLMIVMSEEISKENKNMIFFSQMGAEQKLAIFLDEITQQHIQRGYSGSEVNLRMSRLEIGQHLGLTMETISRTFSKFVKDKLLEIEKKNIKLLDFKKLKKISEIGSDGIRN